MYCGGEDICNKCFGIRRLIKMNSQTKEVFDDIHQNYVLYGQGDETTSSQDDFNLSKKRSTEQMRNEKSHTEVPKLITIERTNVGDLRFTSLIAGVSLLLLLLSFCSTGLMWKKLSALEAEISILNSNLTNLNQLTTSLSASLGNIWKNLDREECKIIVDKCAWDLYTRSFFSLISSTFSSSKETGTTDITEDTKTNAPPIIYNKDIIITAEEKDESLYL